MELSDERGWGCKANLHANFSDGEILIKEQNSGPFNANGLNIFERSNPQYLLEYPARLLTA